MIFENQKGISIYQQLLTRAEHYPEEIMFFDENRSYSAKDILEQVEGTVVGLLEAGVGEKTCVVLRVENNVISAVMLLSLLVVGATIRLANKSVNVIDFFNEESLASSKLYITHENNTGWVAISHIDADVDIIEGKGKVIEAIDEGAPAVVVNATCQKGSSKEKTYSLTDLVRCISGKNDLFDINKESNLLCLLPLDEYAALLFIIAGLFYDFRVFFPELLGDRHILHCLSKYEIASLLVAEADVSALSEVAGEYELGITKRMYVAGVENAGTNYSEQEKKMKMSIIEI